MKKKNLIIIITTIVVIVGAFLIYVIPYGGKVKSFDSRFVAFKNKTNETLAVLNTTDQLSAFNNSLVVLNDQPKDLTNLKEEFDQIKNEENFIKNI